MVEMIPFRGIRYAAGVSKPAVYAPPYDVISPQLRDIYTALDPHNITRIDVTPTPADAGWYEATANCYQTWCSEGIFAQDSVPGYYGYVQHFQLADGTRYTRRGVFVLVRLAEWGQGVFRHEHTRAAPRADRLNLMRATRAQLSPVFGMISDPEAQLSSRLQPPQNPVVDYVDQEATRQVFWPITDQTMVNTFKEFLAPKEIVIADGHHRYETALAYRAERRAAEGDPVALQAYDYVLMYVTAVEDPGLCILPTHRVVQAPGMPSAEVLLSQLRERFKVSSVTTNDTLEHAIRPLGGTNVTIGMYLGKGMRYICRQLSSAGASTDTSNDILHALDVSVLQHGILEPCFGIDAGVLKGGERVAYTISEAEACALVDSGKAQAAFILNPTSLQQVWQTARNLQTMPQKSTYFYPKLLTGLVIHDL